MYIDANKYFSVFFIASIEAILNDGDATQATWNIFTILKWKNPNIKWPLLDSQLIMPLHFFFSIVSIWGNVWNLCGIFRRDEEKTDWKMKYIAICLRQTFFPDSFLVSKRIEASATATYKRFSFEITTGFFFLSIQQNLNK